MNSKMALVSHFLAGYDKTTSRLAIDFRIYDANVEDAYAMAGAVNNGSCWPLHPDIAKPIGMSFTVAAFDEAWRQYDWFLEPYANEMSGGATRRKSMDLTRALAEMRKP